MAAMAEAETKAPITHLNAAWQDWLTTNIMRGCAEADMLKVMAENGFEPLFSRHAIGVVRSMAERLKASGGAPPAEDYKADPIRLPRAPWSGRTIATYGSPWCWSTPTSL